MRTREFPFDWRGVGQSAALVIMALGVVLFAAPPAEAVDLVNRDRVPREVVVNQADGSSRTITVRAGEKVENICDDCVILVGAGSVETRGRLTVRIAGGVVSIESPR